MYDFNKQVFKSDQLDFHIWGPRLVTYAKIKY